MTHSATAITLGTGKMHDSTREPCPKCKRNVLIEVTTMDGRLVESVEVHVCRRVEAEPGPTQRTPPKARPGTLDRETMLDAAADLFRARPWASSAEVYECLAAEHGQALAYSRASWVHNYAAVARQRAGVTARREPRPSYAPARRA